MEKFESNENLEQSFKQDIKEVKTYTPKKVEFKEDIKKKEEELKDLEAQLDEAYWENVEKESQSINLKDILAWSSTENLVNYARNINWDENKVSSFVQKLSELKDDYYDNINDMIMEIADQIADKEENIDWELPKDLIELHNIRNWLELIIDGEESIVKEYFMDLDTYVW